MKIQILALCVLFAAAVSGVASCERNAAVTVPTEDDIYTIDRINPINPHLIRDPSVYRHQEFREMRQRSGMLPEELRDKIAEMVTVVADDFPADSLDVLLDVGLPVWERARVQEDQDGGELLVVPLATATGQSIAGLALFRLRNNHLDSWLLWDRPTLLKLLLDERPVGNRSEYVNLLLTAAFDHYLFDAHPLPAGYPVDPQTPADEMTAAPSTIGGSGPPDTVYFLQECFVREGVDPRGSGEPLSAIICEPFWWRNERSRQVPN